MLKVRYTTLVIQSTDYDVEIKDIDNKCFTTSDYNVFMNDIPDAKIKSKELVNKPGCFWIYK